MTTDIARRTALAGVAALLLPLPAPARKSWKDRPVIVLMEHNVRAMVMGAEAPSFALYLDGTVIFRAYNGYKSVKLDDREMVELMARLDVDALSRENSEYQTTELDHQPIQFFYVFGRRKRVQHYVYGPLLKGAMKGPTWATLVTAYDRMVAFDSPRARPWLPEKIEVMLGPYDHSTGPAIAWPADWPGLDDPATILRSEGQRSLFVPSIRYLALAEIVQSQGARGAVEIGGRKWRASYRFPFPNEQLWMRPEPST